MKPPRARLLAVTTLLAALGGCEKNNGDVLMDDALLILNVTSSPMLTDVPTFKVKVSTVVEAGTPKEATVDFAVPNGQTVTVSSRPVALKVLVPATHGLVEVEVSALYTRGLAGPIELRRGIRIAVPISLVRVPAPPDGGTADGGQDAGDASDAGDAADTHDAADADVTPTVVNRQRALWPMPNNPKDVSSGAPNPASHAAAPDAGTVTDDVTGLIWQKGIAPGLTGEGDTPEVLSQVQAADYCQSLVLGGYENWRVPTLIELVSIVDDSKSNPSTYPSFAGTPPADFWSATPDVEAPANAWTVDFSRSLFVSHKKSDRLHVRCVRSEAHAPARAYMFSEAGTVTDHETQLVWQRSTAVARRAEADALCKAKGSPWRLPTKNELLTLVDFSRSKLTLEPLAFPTKSMDTALYWTSTPPTDGSTKGWAIDFSTGEPKQQVLEIPLSFRCVRSL